MLHPVIAKDGHTYEHDAIQQWFDNGNVYGHHYIQQFYYQLN